MSDMVWRDFKDRIIRWLNLMEVCLVFRLNVDTRAWSDLSCKADFVVMMMLVADKCLVARKQKVTLEVKNMVSKTSNT